MVVSEGVLVGGALGGVGAAALRSQAWVDRIKAGVFGAVAAWATTGIAIRHMEWPRETEVELGVAFLIAITGISIAAKGLQALDGFDLGGFLKSKFGGQRGDDSHG